MQDVRFAIRHLLRHAGFTIAAALTLGLGIGLVATQFSLIDGVLLRPLPFADGERLRHVGVAGDGQNLEWRSVELETFFALREEQTAFDRLVAFTSQAYNLVPPAGAPQQLWGSAVSAGFFDQLRVPPLLGRVLQDADHQPGQPVYAVLGHAAWRDAFGADPSVIGRVVRLNGEPATVVGVMPEGFQFPGRESLWVNMRAAPGHAVDTPGFGVEAMGLLKPGRDADDAATELALIAHRERLAHGTPADEGVRPMTVMRFQRAYNGGSTVPMLATMLAMTGFVLLLACANVANLLFVRASDRMRELAVRTALGADRQRVIRQLLVESLLLAALGALLGIGFAAIGVALLQSQISARIDLLGWMYFDLNPRVLAVAIAAAGVSGMIAGLLPALRASRIDLASALRVDGRGNVGTGGGRRGRWLVAGQLAFACTAMVVAALLATSAVRSSRANLAFDPDSLLIGRIELQGTQYADAAARARFYSALIDGVRATPGVVAAGASSRDLVYQGVWSNFEVGGQAYAREQDKPGAFIEVVTRDYFAVVDRGALAGRLFSLQDTADSAPVALVNRSFAERHWPNADPLGQRIRRSEDGARWATVIGVVPDLGMQGVGNAGQGAGWYLLQDQQGWGWLDLLVRTEGDPSALIGAVRAAVAAVDPQQPIHSIRTLSERTARQVAGLQIIGSMAAVFALVALALSAVGVYGVISHSARRRERELGLRMALGASAAAIVGLVLRQNALQTVVGIVAGLAGGFMLAMPLASLLPDVSASDPLVYAVVGAVLLATTVLACWLPARRAGRVDPQVALRAE
jgi:predicted permease